ncbi:MAG: DUF87 domain-containing protein [Helicobacteraceae bacterium]|jgi:hypothetical protein|nr:DUF87 domain-containing protein [Helicobacteraceae bacterium]
MSDFYLGKTLDGQKLAYDSKTLTTHAAIIGMTGSGKTGLGIALLEEALLSGASAIAIDPKGDLANLFLTFPNLSESEFAPWTDNPAQIADLWKKGLESWGLDAARVKALKDCAEFRLYTPGASHGESVNALGSFAAPPKTVAEDYDLLNSLIASTAENLLGFVGINSATTSKEAALIGAIIAAAWANGENLDLATIIARIVKPPFDKVGVFALESFFPEAKRYDLAAKFNSLIASSAFNAWLRGDPLDVGAIYNAKKPVIAIFSIAHLSDKDRMFFVTLLLNAVLAWMRAQEGSQELRAVLYMDEIFGYFPPSANPPSKTPMLTLLKQARAFGLGAILSTQNPVDLDYKGLSNIGSWFIGRLQTERDRERVLAGLIGAEGDIGALAEEIAALSKRRFILKTDRIQTFETRWTLSYLKGPLSREQIRSLTGGATEEIAQSAPTITLDVNVKKKRAAIEESYEREQKRLTQRRERALARLDKEKSDVKRSIVGAIASIGTSLLGAFIGGRRSSAGRITGAIRSVSAAQKERDDVARAKEEIERIDRELEELRARTQAELSALG